MIVSRQATAEDVKKVHPDQGCSWKAWVCELEGEVVGVIGIALTRPVACIFCWFDEKLRPYLKSMTVLRLLKKVEMAARNNRLPVLAVRDRKEPKAPHILKRMGFQFEALIDGDAIYRLVK